MMCFGARRTLVSRASSRSAHQWRAAGARSSLPEKYPSVFAVIGVHPTYAEEAGEDVITPLRELAKSPRVVAIGETGLDYHHLPSGKQRRQRKCRCCSALQSVRRKNKSKPASTMALTNRNKPILFQQQLDLAVELRAQCGHPSTRRVGRHARDHAAVHRKTARRFSLLRRHARTGK